MLQNVEYHAGPYLRWFWRTKDFSRSAIMRRRTLELTRPARALLLALRCGMALQLALGIAFVLQWIWQDLTAGWQIGLALVVSYPIVWAHLVVLPLVLGRWLVVKPRQAKHIKHAEKRFAAHQGVRIAVVGSYGKTTMKELLLTVLSEGKKVAATPANKNVSISHARFAQKLTDEEILILEYGEGQPGDVRRFAKRTHPTHAVITGVAPAHLDRYKTVQAAAKDIFTVADFVPHNQVFVTDESADAQDFIAKDMQRFSANEALGWKVTDIKVTAEGLSFTMKRRKQRLHMVSSLLGRHNVGPLAFVAALAIELGLTPKQVEDGVAKTKPFEHRMQPRYVGGALLIDDTYNGNLEGVRAGLRLLEDLPAKRRWYVTPGLVDQGKVSAQVHRQIGGLIAAAKPDIVVLMVNSAQPHIWEGLREANFHGEVRTEVNPAEFYTNLPLFLAAGDVVLMQNDWTDNYA
jgi:UDP-N-acetylmuramyl pentapeptide synthase